MQVVMVMFRADGERRSFSLTRDLTVIGRREDCDLRIPLGDVSRKHCRVVRNGDMISLEDLGSSNGTFINGQRITEAVLNAGDTVQVGPVVFCVQIDGVPGEDEMAPIFAAPPEPYNSQAGAAAFEEATGESEEGVAAVGEIEAEAELDDFEAVDAGDAEPAVGAPPAGGEAAELTDDVFLEEAEPAVAGSEAGLEPLEPMPDESESVVAAEGDVEVTEGEEVELIDEELTEPETVDGDAADDQVELEDLIELDEPNNESSEGTKSGKPRSDINRH